MITLIAVIPICTVDRSWEGSSSSRNAVFAPRLPRSAMAFSRGLRAETIDISASAIRAERSDVVSIGFESAARRGRQRSGTPAAGPAKATHQRRDVQRLLAQPLW